MNKKKKLLLGQGILAMILIVSLGVIVVSEKSEEMLKKKADKAMNTYIETNFRELIPSIIIGGTTRVDDVYTKKVMSRNNHNLYFYIKYNKNDFSDTYNTDYEEGNSILNHIAQTIEEKIKKQTNISCTVKPTTTLNEYSTPVKEKILKEEEDLIELKIYYIQTELTIEEWTAQEITNRIKSIIETMNNNHITPKYYEITVTNKKEITTAVKISNITEDFLVNGNSETIISDILNKKEISNSEITYQYQN